MKKMAFLLVVVCLASLAVSCTTHIHKIGAGPQSNDMSIQRQWYILWGLVPINAVDTNVMASGAADYEIRTEMSPLDVLIGIPASWITVSSRTVTVTK